MNSENEKEKSSRVSEWGACEIIRKHFGESVVEAFPAGTIKKFHMEGDTMVIDEMQITSVSITAESFIRHGGIAKENKFIQDDPIV